MAIKKSKAAEKENKFDSAVAQLDEQEALEKEKSEKVVRMITGRSTATRTITDKNGRTRRVRVIEKRKTLPAYIPQTLYEQFDKINRAYGKSNNSAIVELIRDYVTEKKGILEEP